MRTFACFQTRSPGCAAQTKCGAVLTKKKGVVMLFNVSVFAELCYYFSALMPYTWAFPLSFKQSYQRVREQRRYSTSTPSMSARCFPFVVWGRVILFFFKQKMERVCARWIQCNSQRSLLTGYIVSFAPSRASVVPAGFHMQQQQHHHVVYVRLPQTKRSCRVT